MADHNVEIFFVPATLTRKEKIGIAALIAAAGLIWFVDEIQKEEGFLWMSTRRWEQLHPKK